MSVVSATGLPLRLIELNPHFIAEVFKSGHEETVEQVKAHLKSLVNWGPVENADHEQIPLVGDLVVFYVEVIRQGILFIILVSDLYLDVVVVNEFVWEVGEVEVDFGYLQRLYNLDVEIIVHSRPRYAIVTIRAVKYGLSCFIYVRKLLFAIL